MRQGRNKEKLEKVAIRKKRKHENNDKKNQRRGEFSRIKEKKEERKKY